MSRSGNLGNPDAEKESAFRAAPIIPVDVNVGMAYNAAMHIV